MIVLRVRAQMHRKKGVGHDRSKTNHDDNGAPARIMGGRLGTCRARIILATIVLWFDPGGSGFYGGARDAGAG